MMKNIKLAAAVLSCALLLGGCGVESGPVIMTVGDIDVTESEFNFFLTTYTDNVDLGAAKEISLEYCERNHLIVAVAKAMGVEFDDETQEEIKEYKKQVVANYDKTTGYKKFLKENNLTDEYIDLLVSVGFYTDALKEKMGAAEYTDEDKREYFKEHYRRAKHILVSTIDSSTGEEMTGERLEAMRTKAEELLSRAQNGEDFDALIEEYSEDPGSESNPDGYVFTDNEMVIEFQNGVDSIGIGEFSLVKSSYGYHVIQRLALDDDADFFEQEYENAADTLETSMENDRFNEQLEIWAEEYGVTTTVNQEALDAIE